MPTDNKTIHDADATTESFPFQQQLQVPIARAGYLPPDVRWNELILGPTGPFRPLIEKYLATTAPNFYRGQDLVKIRGNLGKFFRFVAQDLAVTQLDEIRPSTITKYIARERSAGMRSHLFLGQLSTFFVWVISEELYDRGNPVINRLHRRQMRFGLDAFATNQRG